MSLCRKALCNVDSKRCASLKYSNEKSQIQLINFFFYCIFFYSIISEVAFIHLIEINGERN
jgi:hypothetical protein